MSRINHTCGYEMFSLVFQLFSVNDMSLPRDSKMLICQLLERTLLNYCVDFGKIYA